VTSCAKKARDKVPVVIEGLAPGVAVICECCDEASLRSELGPSGSFVAAPQ